MLTSIIALSVMTVIFYLLKCIIKPRNFPPGPRWYPYFGSSYIVKKMTRKYGSQWKGLSELAKEYSTQVLGLKLGSEKVVVVYGEKNIRQAFTEKVFTGRPNTFFFRLRCLGKRLGITFTDGPLWREHRQFTVKHLKNVGFGKTLMEKEIQNEMINTVEYIRRNNKKPIDPNDIIPISIMNVLWKFVAGESINENKLKKLLELLNERSEAFTMAGGLLNEIPWIRFLLPNISGYALLASINQKISDIIDEAIYKHKSNAVDRSDFIYLFLQEVNNNKNTYTEEQLKTICLDLLIAGSQATSNILKFAILAVLMYKTVQRKIHDEINILLGDTTPCWADSYRLIYTSAFLLEVQRFYCAVPMAGPRRVLEDTQIDGYFIPKNTTILMSIGDEYFDQKIWESPYEFNPERFIDEKTGTLKNGERLFQFGLGYRRCAGDSLAKSFMFIVFVGIMQKFKIECSNGILPSNEPIIGLLSSPRPFIAKFVLRK